MQKLSTPTFTKHNTIPNMSKFYRFQLHPYMPPESNFEPQTLTKPVPATEGSGAIHPRAEARFTLLGKHAIGMN